MAALRRWYVYGPLTAAIVGLLLWRTRVWEAGDLLAGADLAGIVGAIGLNAVIVGAWALRTQRLLDRLGRFLRLPDLVPIVSFANTINGLTPASAGEVLRAIILHRRHAVPYKVGVAVIVLERVYALGLIVVSASACLAFAAAGATVGLVVLLAGTALAILPSAVYRRGGRLAPIGLPIAQRSPVGRRRLRRLVVQLAGVEREIAVILTSVGAMLTFGLLTAAIFVSMDLQLLLVAQSIGIAIDPVQGWAALGFGAIAGVLSALPFGLGAGDAVIALVLIGFGGDPAAVALITVLLRVVGTLPTGLIGAASLVYLNRTPGGAAAPPPSSNAAPDRPATEPEQ